MAGKLRLGAILFVAAALGLAACGRSPVAEKPPEAGDRAVATVDDKTVWASDVKREAVAQRLIGEGEPLDIASVMFRQVLDEVIDQKLMAAEARKRKLDADPMAQRRLTAAEERILGAMLVEKQVEKAVTDSAINTLYQQQVRLSSQTDEFRARQIVVGTLAEAEAIRKLVQAGAVFETVATQRSTDLSTRMNGGEIPDYFAAAVMPEPIAAALKDAKMGQVIGPFQTESGFVLLKVLDRRPEAPLSLEVVKPQIVRLLTYDEVRELLETLRRDAKVKVLIAEPQEVPGAPREPASAPPPAPGALPAPPPAKAVVAPPAAQPKAAPPKAAPPKARAPRRPAPRAAQPPQASPQPPPQTPPAAPAPPPPEAPPAEATP